MKAKGFSTSLFSSVSRALSVVLIVAFLTSAAPATDKMRPEEVVLKHLESIGTSEARSSVTSRIIIGTCRFSYRSNGIGQTEGNAVMASEGTKSLIGMVFPEVQYPYERLGFDGQRFTTGFVRPSIRTVLGDFLYGHNDIFKEGLVGGALTQAWPLLDMATKNPKLEYEGTQKVHGRDAHVLSYIPRKGSDFQIKLFFDAATFQHIRSDYVKIISGMMGKTIDTSSRQTSTRYEIVEEFSDFKKEGGLTLPHSYRLQLSIDNQAGNQQFEWALSLAQYDFNRPIPAGSFNVESYKDK